jgi:hypothetical protein
MKINWIPEKKIIKITIEEYPGVIFGFTILSIIKYIAKSTLNMVIKTPVIEQM